MARMSTGHNLPLKTSGTLLFLSVLFYLSTGYAASRFPEKQLEAFAKRVGNTYWVVEGENPNPLFFFEPSYSASNFHASPKQSFKITGMVEGADERLYYRLRFSSGKEGYISVDSFMQNLNSSLVTRDPDLQQKKKLADEAEEEVRRVTQIRAQPWPENIKQAAIKKQPALGMRASEVRVVLSKPKKITRLTQRSRAGGNVEQWIYEHGPILTFTDGVLTQIQAPGTQ